MQGSQNAQILERGLQTTTTAIWTIWRIAELVLAEDMF
jgi:hypothetical protein